MSAPTAARSGPALTSPETEVANVRLALYVRSYCHLCEEMLAALAPMRGEFGFDVDTIDVDSDASLQARFDTLVPVLMHADRELCHHRLNAAKVRAYLAKIR